MNSKDAIKILSTIEDGRWKKIFEVIELKDECLSCRFFNRRFTNEFRCKIAPSCGGTTISKELLSYFVWKIGMQSEGQHLKYLMSIGIIPSDQPRTTGPMMNVGKK